MKNKFCTNDFFAAAAIVLLAALLAFMPVFGNGNAQLVQIKYENGERLISLYENGEYDIVSNGHELKLRIKSGKVSVLSSTCMDKICIHSKEISACGEIIVCAPALVSIIIVGENGEADYVIG